MSNLKQTLLTVLVIFFISQKLCAIPAGTFTVASYNVQNLFDLVKNGTEYSEYIPNTHNWNIKTFDIKLENISSVLKFINADIVILSEVENINAANKLKKHLTRKGIYYKYITAGDSPNKTTTCEIILSKFPIISSNTYGIPKNGRYYTRNILEADIDIDGNTLKVFANHWPSKRAKESKRIEVARVLIQRIKQLPKNCDYIIAGDLNSNYNESETFYTSNHDNTGGITAINHILNTVVSSPNKPICYVNRNFSELDTNIKYHYNPWLEVNNIERFSYIYKGSKSTLDHILLSPALFDTIGISYKLNSFKPIRWNGRLMYGNKVFAWEKQFSSNGKYHIGRGYSDHLPIVATFTTTPIDNISTKNICFSYSSHSIVSDFETGVEGWILYNKDFKLDVDNTDSFSGEYSLSLKGRSKYSGEVAKIAINSNHFNTTTNRVSIYLKGSGKFVFGIRKKGLKNYFYSGTNFSTTTNSFRYETYSVSTWQKIDLIIPKKFLGNKIELFVRSAKNTDLNIKLDNLQIY